jgi:hypothetical protein
MRVDVPGVEILFLVGSNMDFTTFYEPQMLLGEISELFSGPVIPKMVIVGLIEGNDENLRLFKEILTKALDNLFVIEFCEQVTTRF